MRFHLHAVAFANARALELVVGRVLFTRVGVMYGENHVA